VARGYGWPYLRGLDSCRIEHGVRCRVKDEYMESLTSRRAVSGDIPALTVLMNAAIAELQSSYLDEDQIASSRAIMGIDTELIDDGTYFVVESGDEIAGCGGWSRRATLYGGNQTPGRDSKLLDPAVDPARVRAMYTNPAHARRGVGRLILSLCEAAAAAEGFTRLELMSTLSGEPLYTAYGFRQLERLDDSTGGASVPLIRMEKAVDPILASSLPVVVRHVPAARETS
jgi:GNAT superfamily N-acetyltransferase